MDINNPFYLEILSSLNESDGITIPVVHINHLIKMKENTKRLGDNMKDLVDAAELKKILKIDGSVKTDKK